MLRILYLTIAIGLLGQGCSALFCSSYCVAETVCWSTGTTACQGCAESIFHLEPGHPTGECQLLNQTQIVVFELASTIDLTGYSTNNPVPYNCTASYPLSGQYSSGDYLAKRYTGLPVSHYYAIVRFAIAYMGAWANTDMFAVVVDGVQKSWNYSCGTNQAICTASDCIRQYQAKQNHSSTEINFNVTASMAGSPPTQSWGIREILIAVRTCHPSCMTCYGPKATQCYSCQPDHFIEGLACVPSCPHFTVRSMGVCLETCPDSYYTQLQDCEMCHEDCATCHGPDSSDCITWLNESMSQKFSSNLQLWIFIIVLAIAIAAGLLWYFLNRRKAIMEEQQRTMQIRQKMLMSESNINVNELRESKIFEFKKPSSVLRVNSNQSPQTNMVTIEL